MGTANPRPTQQLLKEQLARFAPYIACGIILIIVPLFLSSYVQGLMTKVLIYAIFAMSLDLIFGYTGLFSLGHAAYFGVGVYTVAILVLRYGINSFWIAAPSGILMSTLIAAIFGLIALRVSGLYFLMITFALGQLLVSIAVKWYPMTGGMYGMSGVPRPDLGLLWLTWNATNFYYFVFLAFVTCFFILSRLVNSPFGYSLVSIRDCEPKMKSVGYNTWLHKYIAFVIAGMFAGLAGVLLAYHYGHAAPTHLGVMNSALAMFMVIIGGVGTLYGSLIGSGVIVFLEFFVSGFTPERWPLIVGCVFVASAMYARGGIGIHLSRFWKKVGYQYGSTKD